MLDSSKWGSLVPLNRKLLINTSTQAHFLTHFSSLCSKLVDCFKMPLLGTLVRFSAIADSYCELPDNLVMNNASEVSKNIGNSDRTQYSLVQKITKCPTSVNFIRHVIYSHFFTTNLPMFRFYKYIQSFFQADVSFCNTQMYIKYEHS